MKQKKYNKDQKLQALLNKYQPDFKPFFETRVMGQIAGISQDYLFSRAFQRIALSGIAALITLIIIMSINDGSLSTDTLMGTSNLNIESLTTIALNGF